MPLRALKRRLVATAARRYRRAGPFAYHFARGKLQGDPVFAALLARRLVPDGARILDLGCGQGLLAAWLAAAAERHGAGDWHEGWPAPPTGWSFRGIELSPRAVARATAALGALAPVEVGDIRLVAYAAADAVVLLDVLHYLDEPSQRAVLARALAALSPAGVLLIRVGDADGGLRFRFSNWVDRAVLFARGQGFAPLHCRRLGDWIDVLERLGCRTDAVPMSGATPFANVLLVARPR